MRKRCLVPLLLIAGLVASCGSSSARMTVGQVRDKYAAAVKLIVPRPLPPGVPSSFPAGLARTAEQDCVQQAARLGYGSRDRSMRRVIIAHSKAAVLIHDLTVNTTVHVPL